MEYTKGEWTKEGNKIKVFGKGTVAICPSPTNDRGVLEFIANARLIAAAPDLYEACKEIMERLNGGIRFPLQSTCDKMNQALAKAKGE